MSDRYVSADLLFQWQNAAIDLARQLGAAEANLKQLQADSGRPLYVVPEPVKFEADVSPRDDDLRGSELWRMQQAAISVIAGCNTPASYTMQKLPSDNMYRTPALADVERAVCREIRLIEQFRIADVALRELAELGGGTSHGNDIAKQALRLIGQAPVLA